MHGVVVGVARVLIDLRVFPHEPRVLAVLRPLEGEEGRVEDHGVKREGEGCGVTRVGKQAADAHEELAHGQSEREQVQGL